MMLENIIDDRVAADCELYLILPRCSV